MDKSKEKKRKQVEEEELESKRVKDGENASKGKKQQKSKNKQKDEESSSEEESKSNMIDLEFELVNFAEEDFHSLKLYSKQLLDEEEYNSAELVDLILQQKGVGSIIKVNGSEEGYGFISVINLTKHKDKECVKEIKKFILNKAKKQPANVQEQLKKYFEDSEPLGLLLNERMVNIPLELAPHLHKFLYNDLVEAKKLEKDPKKSPLHFENLLLLSTSFKIRETEEDDSDSEEETGFIKKKKKSKGKKAKTTEFEEQYYRAEEELFIKESDLHFKYDLQVDKELAKLDTMVSESRHVAIFKFSKLKGLLEKIEKLV